MTVGRKAVRDTGHSSTAFREGKAALREVLVVRAS